MSIESGAKLPYQVMCAFGEDGYFSAMRHLGLTPVGNDGVLSRTFVCACQVMRGLPDVPDTIFLYRFKKPVPDFIAIYAAVTTVTIRAWWQAYPETSVDTGADAIPPLVEAVMRCVSSALVRDAVAHVEKKK